ncbi:MAG TPA: hypothetical protein VMV10_20220 [Pirellulales bacterium]|nr:hypothetical protein [Pirellulales bacterium]
MNRPRSNRRAPKVSSAVELAYDAFGPVRKDATYFPGELIVSDPREPSTVAAN